MIYKINEGYYGTETERTAMVMKPNRVGEKFFCTDSGIAYVYSGSAWANQNPKSEIDNGWSFACSAAIINTTPVTIKAAPGTGKYIYLTDLYLKNTNATVTEVTIKSDITVLLRLHVGASMAFADVINFKTPIKGLANKPFTITCTTTGANVFVNASGFVG